MKTKSLFLVSALMATLNWIPIGRVTAQTFTTLHSFTGSDGAHAGLITNISGNTLYGSSGGTVFAVNTDGTGFTNLHSFTALSGSLSTNSDGALPVGELVLSGNTLYGTASSGGGFGNGTVFSVNTDGTGFTTLYSFAGYPTDGAIPQAGLILSGNILYGTALFGGSSSAGTLFALNTNGARFTNLHTFAGGSDGGGPLGRLILSGNTLYGTTGGGGSGNAGTVFAVNTNGTGFTTLHSFAAGTPSCRSGPNYYCLINSDGAYPQAGLIQSGNTLYGTASGGGSGGSGAVFALNTDGSGFTNLHSFTARSGPGYPDFYSGINSDGGNPNGLILSGTTLSGSASIGGLSGYGTMFAVNTDGTGFTILHTFTGVSDGARPAGLIQSGNTLYGTAGVVFSLSFRPQLAITPSATNVILSWPISYAGFSYAEYLLQEAANLGSPDGWVVSDAFPAVIVDGQVRVTDSMLGPQRFYRLSK
jgi:uncharacterized repeat protein (TIGR03803 family)